jgi:hypothetical protein
MAHHAIKSNPKRHKAAVAHMKTQLAAMKGAIAEPGESKVAEKAESPATEAAEKAAGIS